MFTGYFVNDEQVSGNVHARYYVLYDYENIEIDQVSRMLQVYKDLDEESKTTDCLYTPYSNYSEIFEQFLKDSSKVKATMWILQVPVLVLLGVFIFMVSYRVVSLP